MQTTNIKRGEIEKMVHQIIAYSLPDTLQNRHFEDLKKRDLHNELELDSVLQTELFYRMASKLKINPDITKLHYMQNLDQITEYLYQQAQQESGEIVATDLNQELKDASKGPTPGKHLSFFNNSPSALKFRLQSIEEKTGSSIEILSQKLQTMDGDRLKGHIENYVGDTLIPTGVVGPILIQGELAQGHYFVPLCTMEGALVASVHRGAMVINGTDGGARVRVLYTQMVKTPLLVLKDLWAVRQMEIWLIEKLEELKRVVAESSRFARLKEIKYLSFGRRLTLRCLFETGDAAGQNMVTHATEKLLEYIKIYSPVKIESCLLDNALSGDKKLNMMNYTSTRGRRVTAEVAISRRLVEAYFHTTPEKILSLYQEGALSGHLSGTIGMNSHFANVLTALFIATGQDIASVHESAVGTAFYELVDNHLVASILIPNLAVGTVGGGTSLPSQVENLKIMECYEQSANKLAEIFAVTVLAGELSIASTHAAGDFTKAHEKAHSKSGHISGNVLAN